MNMHRLEYKKFCSLPEFLIREIEDMPETRERAVRYMNTGAHRCFEHRHAAHQVWNRMSMRRKLDMLERSSRSHERAVYVLNALHGRLAKEKKAGTRKGAKCRRY